MTETEDAILTQIEERITSINNWFTLWRDGTVTPFDLAIALHTHGDFLRRDASRLLEVEVDEDEKVYDDQT